MIIVASFLPQDIPMIAQLTALNVENAVRRFRNQLHIMCDKQDAAPLSGKPLQQLDREMHIEAVQSAGRLVKYQQASAACLSQR